MLCNRKTPVNAVNSKDRSGDVMQNIGEHVWQIKGYIMINSQFRPSETRGKSYIGRWHQLLSTNPIKN